MTTHLRWRIAGEQQWLGVTMASRDGAIAQALAFFDGGGFRDRLAELVAIPSTSQDPGHEADVDRYLRETMQPWLARLG